MIITIAYHGVMDMFASTADAIIIEQAHPTLCIVTISINMYTFRISTSIDVTLIQCKNVLSHLLID